MATEKLIWISPVTGEGVPRSTKEKSVMLEMSVPLKDYSKQMEGTVHVKGGGHTAYYGITQMLAKFCVTWRCNRIL